MPREWFLFILYFICDITIFFFWWFLLFFNFFYLGRPQPEVRWLVNGLLVDDQYEHNSGDVIENRLLWPSVQRTDLNSVFTCQAINTILVEPKESSYVMDLHRKYFIFYFLPFPILTYFIFYIEVSETWCIINRKRYKLI